MQQTDTMRTPMLRVKQDPVSRIVNLEFRRDVPLGRFSPDQIAQIRVETAAQIDRLDLRKHERAQVEEMVAQTITRLEVGGIGRAGAESLIAALQALVAQVNGFAPAVESLARCQDHGSAVLGLGTASGMLAGAAALLATAGDIIERIAVQGHAEPPSDDAQTTDEVKA
jgi:hypothetical protein